MHSEILVARKTNMGPLDDGLSSTSKYLNT